MKNLNAILWLGLTASASIFANVTGVNLCSTGFATATTSGCGSAINSPAANNLLADGNWYTSNSSGSFQSQSFVTVNNAYPLQNGGPWPANGAASAWIVPGSDQSTVYGSQAFYYSTSFTLDGTVDLAALSIAGFWITDDSGAGIFLNGVAVGQAMLPPANSVGGPMTPFLITQGDPMLGQAAFVVGSNVITFGVNNIGSSVTGVRVQFSDISEAPEPATFVLIGCSLAAISISRRRLLRAVDHQ